MTFFFSFHFIQLKDLGWTEPPKTGSCETGWVVFINFLDLLDWNTHGYGDRLNIKEEMEWHVRVGRAVEGNRWRATNIQRNFTLKWYLWWKEAWKLCNGFLCYCLFLFIDMVTWKSQHPIRLKNGMTRNTWWQNFINMPKKCVVSAKLTRSHRYGNLQISIIIGSISYVCIREAQWFVIHNCSNGPNQI